jgi:hypothetical protein
VIAYLGLHINDPVGFRERHGFTTCPGMSGPSPSGFSLFGLFGIGLQRNFSGRRGRTKEPLFLLPSLIGKLLPKTLNLLLKRVYLSLFL